MDTFVKDQSITPQSTASLWGEILGSSRSGEIVGALFEAMLTLVTTKDQNERANAVRKIKDINTALTASFQAMENNKKLPLTPARLTRLIQGSGLSQAEFAEAIGVSQGNVSEWIKGTRPIPQKHAEKIYKTCIGSVFTRVLEVEASILDGYPENQSAA